MRDTVLPTDASPTIPPAVQAEAAGASAPPVPEVSLRRSFSWVLAGNILYAAAQWGMLVVLAKLLSTEEVGKFALGLAISSPVMIFANLKLRSALVTDTVGEYTLGDYVALRLISSLAALLVIAGIAFLGGFAADTAAVIMLAGLIKAVDSVSDIFQGQMQKHEQMREIAVGMIANGVLSLVLLGLFVLFTRNVVWGMVGSLAGSVGVLLGYNLPQTRIISMRFGEVVRGERSLLRPRVRWGMLWALTAVTLPLAISTSLGSLATSLPRLFVERWFGEQLLGIYAALAYLLVAGAMVLTALGQAATPRLARYYASGDPRGFFQLLRKLLLMGSAIGLAGLVVCLLLGEDLLRLIYSEEYAAHADVLVLLAASSLISAAYLFLGTGVTAMREFRAQGRIACVSFVVLSVASYLLIAPMGLRGAAWAAVLAASTEAILYLVFFARRFTRWSSAATASLDGGPA